MFMVRTVTLLLSLLTPLFQTFSLPFKKLFKTGIKSEKAGHDKVFMRSCFFNKSKAITKIPTWIQILCNPSLPPLTQVCQVAIVLSFLLLHGFRELKNILLSTCTHTVEVLLRTFLNILKSNLNLKRFLGHQEKKEVFVNLCLLYTSIKT